MPTIDELLNEASELLTVCEIDADTREIAIPDEYRFFGIESDENVRRIPFRCSKVVGDGVDLSKLNIYINYANGNSETNVYSVDDVAIDGDYITFSWLLSRNVTKYAGTVSFIICAKETDDGEIITEWNTKIAFGTVDAGLEAVETVEQTSSDIIDQMIKSINQLNDQMGGAYDDSAIKELQDQLDKLQNTSRTQEDITVNGVTGLGIDNGSVIPVGTSFNEFVKMVTQKPIPATYTKPSLSIANNGGQSSGNVEAGTTITPKLKATFNKNDAGDLESIVIKKSGSEVVSGSISPLTYTGDAIVIGDESITFSASATYGDAPIKTNNLGKESTENWFAGGTINSSNYTITGKRKLFYGTGAGDIPEITSGMIRGLANYKLAPAANTTFSINVAVGQQYIVIAYPSTIRDINNVTYVEANDSGMASNFTKSTIAVADARGGSNGTMSYKVFTYAMAVPAAASMTFTVKI